MHTADSLRNDIRHHYDQGREDARLREGRGRLELWRTQDILRRWIRLTEAKPSLLGASSHLMGLATRPGTGEL